MARASKAGVNAPYLLFVDEINKAVGMQYISNSVSAKVYLQTHNISKELIQTIATTIAKLHNADIIHGDLTTSNLLIQIHAINIPYADINFSEQKIVDTIQKDGGDVVKL